MLRTPVYALLFPALLAPAAATGAPSTPLRLELRTLDDDLRAGGAVWFVLRMRDGTEQSEPVVNGTPLANQSAVEFRVAPRAPCDWAQVRDFGLRVRPHAGDGALLRPDEWKVFVVLHGLSNCGASAASRLPPGEPCFSSRNASLHFPREETQWVPLNSIVGRCREDFDCNAARPFCAERTQRCLPSGGDFMGCAPLARPEPACRAGMTCLAERRQCVVSFCENPDRDGDGGDSLVCGGHDCDDEDPLRNATFTEVCDVEGVDEDCDPTTVGRTDGDRDGFIDTSCWNPRPER